MAGACLLASLVANCGAPPQGGRSASENKYGVPASPRVVADGQPVPKGGGRAMLGKPYTIAGQLYTPREDPHYAAVGTASWYGDAFHGRLTANGEVFDKESIAAAHPTLPLPSYARVTNLDNRRSMVVRVNDRGPYHGRRVIDVSQRVAEALDFRHMGLGRVKVEYLGRASVNGSDDRKLLASLSEGRPARMPAGGAASTMIARASEEDRREAFREPAVRVASAAPLAAPAVAAVEPRRPSPVVSAASTSSAPTSVASRSTVGMSSSGAPVPPQRASALGAVSAAATPGGLPSVARPARAPAPYRPPLAASLYFAEPEAVSHFGPSGPFGALGPQRFVPLSARRAAGGDPPR